MGWGISGHPTSGGGGGTPPSGGSALAPPRKRLYRTPTAPAAPPVTQGTVPSYYSPGQEITREQYLNVNDTHEQKAVRVCYGTVRYSPLAVHTEIVNSTLWLVYHLGEGEINALKQVYYGGTLIWDSGTGKVSWANVDWRPGSLSQTALSGPPNWPATSHPGHALLLISVNLASAEIAGGSPDVEVVLEGRKLYDFRTSTTAFGDNPVLIAYDLLTHTEYGAGLSAGEIDTAGTWKAAADRCDETVNSVHRWRAATVLTERQPVVDVARSLLQQSCAGALYWADGAWRIWLDEQHVIGNRTGALSANTTVDRAVSFPAPGPRIKVVLGLNLDAGFTNPTAKLRSSVAGPDDLASVTVTGLSAGNDQEVTFDFSSVRLTVGATYWIILPIATGVHWKYVAAGVSPYQFWSNVPPWAYAPGYTPWFQVHYADWEIADAVVVGAGQIPILGVGKGKSSLSFSRDRGESANVVVGTYYDIANWQQTEVRYEGPGVQAGTEQPRELRQQLLAVPGPDQCYRLTRQWYMLAQRTLHIGCLVPQHGIQIAPGDVAAVTSGIGTLSTLWCRVRSVSRGFGVFQLELVPYRWQDYSREEIATLDSITIPSAQSNLRFQLVKDDFTRGSGTSLDIGEQGWRLAAGSVSYTSETDHNGIGVGAANTGIALDSPGQKWAPKSSWATKWIVKTFVPSNGQGCTFADVFSFVFTNSAGSIGLSVDGVATGETWVDNTWLTIECRCDGGSTAYFTVTQGTHVYSGSKTVTDTTQSASLGATGSGGGTWKIDLAQVAFGRNS